MRNKLTKVNMICLVLLIAGLTVGSFAQVNITINFNSSTVLDTLSENGFVEIRGAYNDAAPGTLPDGNTIDWGSASTLEMANVGGDYWTLTFQMNPGDTLIYKFWTGFDADNGTHTNSGWEGNFEDEIGTTNRWFIAGATDTVMLLYYHADGTDIVNQYWRPFESKEDSVAIYFRVNMSGIAQQEELDLTTIDTVGVRGDSTKSAGGLDWDFTKPVLNWETLSRDSMFFSGVVYVPVEKAGEEQPYKFVYHDPDFGVNWEGSIGDRLFNYPTSDTTLHWIYFDNKEPTTEEPFDGIIVWRASTEALENVGFFDRGVGDNIEIRGPKGWDAEDAISMDFNAILQEWTTTEPFSSIPGTEFFYKYYVDWDSSRVDSTSENYIPLLGLDNGWEEPGTQGGGNRSYVYEELAQQFPTGDFGFDRQFFNGVPPNGTIDHNVTVTWNIDMTKATDVVENPEALFAPGDTVWIVFDGELIAFTQGKEMWNDAQGAADVVMLEDPDEDMVYSGSYEFQVSADFPAIWFQLGYKVKYITVAGEEVLHGAGNEKGRRIMQYIQPTSIDPGTPWPVTNWPTEYEFPVVEWTHRDLFVEDAPDLTTPTAIEEKEVLPYKFALNQNFPNPFNPTTNISYQLAKQTKVEIGIYNITGQLVETLVDEDQNAGHYAVVWDGKNQSGTTAATGIYFLKMKTKEFSKVRKMMLIR